MAKEKPSDPDKAARKAEKRAQKAAAAAAAEATTTSANGDTSTPAPTLSTTTSKRADRDGVYKSKSKSSSSKSVDDATKKEKKAKVLAIEAELEKIDATAKLLDKLDENNPGTVVIKSGPAAAAADDAKNGEDGEDTEMADGAGTLTVKVKTAPLLGALVPFANPLADERVGKKVLKTVKKGICFLHSPQSPSPPPSPFSHILTKNPYYSKQITHPPPRGKRSRQSPPQIRPRPRPWYLLQYLLLLQTPHRNRHPSRRHKSHGRNIPPPRLVRRPQRALHIRAQSCRARCGEFDQETDECGYGEQG